MIFTEKENHSRRQFHELFCTKYLYTGKARGALNEESWNSDILYDILRNVYEDTILTPQDIETILQIGGMYDADGKLYFHYREETPVIKEVLYAMSSFISDASYIRLRQRLNCGATNSSDSVAAFLKCCCTNTQIEPEKIPIKQCYEYYEYWCALNKEIMVSKRVFSRRLNEIGFVVKKGYVNGDSGILYVIIRLDKEEVNKIAQQTRTQTETEEKLDGSKSLRDVHGTGAEVLKNLIKGEESCISENEGGENPPTIGGRSSDKYEEDDGNDFTIKPIIYGGGNIKVTADDDIKQLTGNSDDEDDFDWSTEDSDTEDGYDIVDEFDTTGTEKLIIPECTNKEEAETFIKTLPFNIRTAFKQMKVTYRISPDALRQNEFCSMLLAAGVANIDFEHLYQIFELYARP